MSSRRQRNVPLGGRYRQVSLYIVDCMPYPLLCPLMSLVFIPPGFGITLCCVLLSGLLLIIDFNTPRPRKNWQNSAEDIFKRIFFNENCSISTKKFTEICSQKSNYKYSSNGSENGLVPVRWQAIIWINSGLVYWLINASLDFSEWIHRPLRDVVLF